MGHFTDQRFVGLLEAAPDAMLCVDADGCIALVNGQAEHMFGYGRGELIGKRIEILVPEPLRSAHRAERSGYSANPRPRPMGEGLELAGRRRDGSTFPVEISLSAFDTREGMLISAAVRDITQSLAARAERERLKAEAARARLERQVNQFQRQESLSRLAGGVARDFNNLLRVISNYASFISDEVAKEAPQVRLHAVREDIEQIQQAAERAAGLTRQLLAFARRDVVKRRVLNLNDVITDLSEMIARTLGEHVELATSLAPDLDRVLADPGQIEQVLVNLAVNARDAMPAGGKLTIETSNTVVDEAYGAAEAGLDPGFYVALKVSDTGAGIPEDNVDRVFEPFFTTKPEGQGSGLGLATVYGIIAQAGGHTRIYSEPGLGTTVKALLPIIELASEPMRPPPQEAEGGGGEVVLVVEDGDAMREATRRILDRNGYAVLTAAGGHAAIGTLASYPGHVDVLLTDVVMPQMLGKEVAERIRAFRPDIRVLFMSGYAGGLLGAQGVLESDVHLIEKPFSESSLLAKLREVILAPS